jgi:hypothetical protein
MLAGFRSRLVLFGTMLDDPNNQTVKALRGTVFFKYSCRICVVS